MRYRVTVPWLCWGDSGSHMTRISVVVVLSRESCGAVLGTETQNVAFRNIHRRHPQEEVKLPFPRHSPPSGIATVTGLEG